jgi:hypothetical protein
MPNPRDTDHVAGWRRAQLCASACYIRGISDFNFTFAQNHTPVAPSVQAQITMASLGGIAARFGRSAELRRLFGQPQPASPLTLIPSG